jgi:FixJ family two-component response regulator
LNAHAVAFLSKPFDDEVLLEKVRHAMKGLEQGHSRRSFQEEHCDEFNRLGFFETARSVTFAVESRTLGDGD